MPGWENKLQSPDRILVSTAQRAVTNSLLVQLVHAWLARLDFHHLLKVPLRAYNAKLAEKQGMRAWRNVMLAMLVTSQTKLHLLLAKCAQPVCTTLPPRMTIMYIKMKRARRVVRYVHRISVHKLVGLHALQNVHVRQDHLKIQTEGVSIVRLESSVMERPLMILHASVRVQAAAILRLENRFCPVGTGPGSQQLILHGHELVDANGNPTCEDITGDDWCNCERGAVSLCRKGGLANVANPYHVPLENMRLRWE